MTLGPIEQRAEAVLVLIGGDAPALSADEMAAHFKMSRSGFDKTQHLLRDPKNRRIYIAAYRPPPNNKGAHLALFKAGNLPDVPTPKATPEQQRERRQRDVDLQRERRIARRNDPSAWRNKPPSGFKPSIDPFSAALFGRPVSMDD